MLGCLLIKTSNLVASRSWFGMIGLGVHIRLFVAVAGSLI